MLDRYERKGRLVMLGIAAPLKPETR